MIIRNITAIVAAIFLITINKAEARLNEFCGDRYCGQKVQVQQTQYYQVRKYRSYYKKSAKRVIKRSKIAAHKPKLVQLSSMGFDEAGFTGESPRAVPLLSLATRYIGTNPTGWRTVWCARFIAYIAPSAATVLKRMGLNPNWARDYARLPGARREGRIGDIVVLTRGRGGHIGVVKKFDSRGNPVVISGNWWDRNKTRRVGVSTYSKSRVLAYVHWT